jgi:hypothetical protein
MVKFYVNILDAFVFAFAGMVVGTVVGDIVKKS